MAAPIVVGGIETSANTGVGIWDDYYVAASLGVPAIALGPVGLPVVVGVGVVLALALSTYGIPHLVHPALTLAGLAAGTATVMLLGIAIGLAAPSARAAQAIGVLAFFPLYLLDGGGPPRGVMTGAMHVISDVIPSAVPGIVEPWLGLGGPGSKLLVLAAWSAAALGATVWLARRTAA